jgi:hypothetical protein
VIIDFLIVIVVGGAAWLGFQRGLVQPLLAELFALGALLLILHNRATFAAGAEAILHVSGLLAAVVALAFSLMMGYLGGRLGGLIRRMPVVTGVDGFVGVWLQALFGIAICYLVISGIIVLDRTFTPITTPNVSAVQLAAIEGQLAGNPFTSGAVDDHELQPFDARASRPGGVALADVPGISGLQGAERDLLRPQLVGSHLSHSVMSVGRHIPGLGPYGPQDLPKRRVVTTSP